MAIIGTGAAAVGAVIGSGGALLPAIMAGLAASGGSAGTLFMEKPGNEGSKGK
jgi:hypothetical protein